MESNKLSMALNLSSQANMKKTRGFTLSQFNFVVVLGSRLTGAYERLSEKIKVSVNIKKSGGVEINGLPAQDTKDPNIKVYSKIKKTVSDENEHGINTGVCHYNDDYIDTMPNFFTGGETDG